MTSPQQKKPIFKDRYMSTHVMQLMFGKRKFLINPKFQYRFMGFTLVIIALSVGAFYCANYFFFENFIEKGVNLNLPKDHTFFIILKEQQSFMSRIFAAVTISLTVIFAVLGLFYSHRIAGPMFRLNRHLKEAAKNKKMDNIKFRQDDFFPEIAESLNEYAASAEKKNVEVVPNSKESPKQKVA